MIVLFLVGGINLEMGVDIYTLLNATQNNNKSLLYSTENSTQFSVMTYSGIASEKREDICTYREFILLYT